jgi:hydroxyacylglutathione hydrolase
MIEKITNDIYKLNVDSNVYLIKNQNIIIDTGPKNYKDEVKQELSKITDLKKIKKVIFTHLHADHMGNFDLFPNAEFFTSKQEIEDFKKNKIGAILDPLLAVKFKVNLKPLKELQGFKVINTPGHTKGSICLFYEKEKLLFSGDTLFNNGIGRTDLPTSEESKMEDSLNKLKKLDYKLLCPGHDY